MDDEITRLDTNQSKVPTIDPYICGIIQEHQQIWAYTNKQTQHDMFLASSYYRDFLEANPKYAESKSGVGYTVWMEALAEVASFVSNPKDKSCVDQKISSLENLMLSIYKVMRYPRVKENLKKYNPKDNELTYDELYTILRKAGSFQFLDLIY